jgi:hypothetical protein
MRKLIFAVLMLLSCTSSAFDIYNGTNSAGKDQWSTSSVIVNGADGKPMLQQDMINNANSSQVTRHFGYVFGRNPAVQNVRCDLWSGPTCKYVFPTIAMQMAVVSSSVNDSAAGTGCRTVYVHYLDDAYAVQTIIVTLNGTTPVNTLPVNILRINAFHCGSNGSTGAAAGNISITSVGGATTYGYIVSGENTARQAIYTVPAGVSGYISHWQASSGSASGTHFTQIAIKATSHEGVLLPGVFLLVDEIGTLNGEGNINLPIPIRIPGMADVKMDAISDAANANAIANGAIMGWFEQ